FSITVSAETVGNQVFAGYRGTVQFTSTDRGAGVVLPANYTFTAADNGVHTFTGLRFVTSGTQSVTATDTVSNSITGSASVAVSAAAAVRFTLLAPTSSAA